MRFRIRRFTRSLLRSLPEAERSLDGGGQVRPACCSAKRDVPTEEKEASKKDDKKGKKAEDEEVECEKEASSFRSTEMDIELSGPVDDDLDPVEVARLSSLFDDGINAEDEEDSCKKEASQNKAGIKKLGGQPKVASADGTGVELSSLWNSAPDVSEVFR